KLELRCFVPKPRLLRYDQVPVVDPVRQPELVEALRTTSELGRKAGQNDRHNGIRIERPCVVLARVCLCEGRPEVREINYRSPCAVDSRRVVHADRGPRLECRDPPKTEPVKEPAPDAAKVSSPRKVVNPARDEPVGHVLCGQTTARRSIEQIQIPTRRI